MLQRSVIPAKPIKKTDCVLWSNVPFGNIAYITVKPPISNADFGIRVIGGFGYRFLQKDDSTAVKG